MATYLADLVAETYGLPHDGFFGNDWTDRGVRMEPEARAKFAESTGLFVSEVGFATRDDKIVGCSPDGFVSEKLGGEPIGGLELKDPCPRKHVRWIAEGILPDEHKLQVHGSMAVTGFGPVVVHVLLPEADAADYRG